MNRKQIMPKQNDIPLNIGTLPKRLQMKFAANCNCAVVEDNHNNVDQEDNEEKTNAENKIPPTNNNNNNSQTIAVADVHDVRNGEQSKKEKQLQILRRQQQQQQQHQRQDQQKQQQQNHAVVVKAAAAAVVAPVLEASGFQEKALAKAFADAVGGNNLMLASKPGLLRLKESEVVLMKNDDKKEQNNKKYNNKNNSRKRSKTHPSRQSMENLKLCPSAPSEHRVRLTTEHPEWFEHLVKMPNGNIVIQLYDQLMVIQERNLLLVNWSIFCEIQEKLQAFFRKLLLTHLKFTCEQKVDTFFWKLLLYNVREHLKAQGTEVSLKHIPPLIEQSLNFYTTLLEDIKSKFFNSSTKMESIARVVAQRLLIVMGDMSRYRAIHLQTNNFNDTFRYYHQAQALMPTNGAPYHQLAIVAVHARKKFDAIYYYMRSLLTSNSIETAKESILDLFDDIRRKYEENELKRSPLHQIALKQKILDSTSMRKEVWIYPDGVRRLHRTDVKNNNNRNKATVAEEERFDDMTTDELLRRIFILYLYLIGKFFTGIGVENVYEHLRKFIIQFSAALKRKNLLTRSKMLKIAALNIFVVEHNKLKENRREIRYHAFNFCNAIFGLMLRKANQILQTPKHYDDIEGLEDEFVDLNTTLQYIRIYVKWLSNNVDIWEPIRNEDHAFNDCWKELQQLFCNITRIFDKPDVDFDVKLKHVILDEDIYLNGFAPLDSNTINTSNSSSSSPATESVQFLKRISRIAEFQQCFEEYQDYLQQSLNSSFVLEELNSDMKDALNDLSINNKSADKIDDISNESIMAVAAATKVIIPTTAASAPDANLTQLSKLKRELEEKNKTKQLCNAKLDEILKFVDTKLYIEVRPRYLLPDTNCFIDCLEDFERLASEFTRYTLIIPLTVVKELDGLSKGVKLDSYKYSMQKNRIHHFDEVSSRAKKTLEFIRKSKFNVKCATTKGSIINANLFALVEEEYASNDDKILATAVSLFKNLSTETYKDGKCLIQTELVLITTDRNLRVKALSRNLAVSALDEFLQWAKNSSSES